MFSYPADTIGFPAFLFWVFVLQLQLRPFPAQWAISLHGCVPAKRKLVHGKNDKILPCPQNPSSKVLIVCKRYQMHPGSHFLHSQHSQGFWVSRVQPWLILHKYC